MIRCEVSMNEQQSRVSVQLTTVIVLTIVTFVVLSSFRSNIFLHNDILLNGTL